MVQFGGRAWQQTYQGPNQEPGESEGPMESGLPDRPEGQTATPPVWPQEVEEPRWVLAEEVGEVPQQWLLER